jgi:HEAT repeat protein
MKDLKIVIAIAVPLICVAGGLWVMQGFLGPDEDIDIVDADPPRRGRPELRDPGPVIPQDEWPKEPGAGVGPSSPFLKPGARVPVDGTDESTVLTVALLRELLASAKQADFRKIEALLRRGAVEEPFLLAEILMEHIDKGDNFGHWMGKFLALFEDDRLREKIATDLLARLDTLEDRNGLMGAIEAIGKVGGPKNVPDLAKIARGHASRDAVTRALYALADIGGKEAATELAAYLKENVGNDDRQPLALNAIEKLKTPEMVKALDGLLTDEDEKVRLAGVNALAQAAGTKAATDKLIDLWKKGGELGKAAGLRLGKATGREATDRYVELIDDVEEVNVKVQMTRGLGNNGGEPARAKCFDLLKDPDEKEAVRAEAAASLAKMGDGRGVSVMIDIVSSPRPESRSLDRKVLNAIAPLISKNREAAEELRKKALPILRKRMEEDPRSTNIHQLRMAIASLEMSRPGPE